MPTERIELPGLTAPIEAELVYLQTSKVRGELMYLHSIKQNAKQYENYQAAEQYWLKLATNMSTLTNEVRISGHESFNFLIAPPSDLSLIHI